jgi:transposase
MSQTLGRPIHVQRGWEWVRRLGYAPQWPRPRETRDDPEAQEAFKKGARRRGLGREGRAS